MTNTHPSSARAPGTAISTPISKDGLKIATRSRVTKPIPAESSKVATNAAYLHSKKLAVATVKNFLCVSPEGSTATTQTPTEITQLSQASTMPNGQTVIDLEQVFDQSPLPSLPATQVTHTLHADMPEFMLAFQKQLRTMEAKMLAQDTRFDYMENILKEHQEQKLIIIQQAAEIAELKQLLLNQQQQAATDEEMEITQPFSTAPEVPLSSANSKYASMPPSSTTQPTPPTMAQIAAINAHKKVAKRTNTTKKPSPAAIAAAARPFQSTTEGPKGFKYIYIGRSRKITRAETRRRFRKVGVDTNRILDITFPASNMIGVLLHLQYEETFITTMKAVGAEVFPHFDPLDPKYLANPEYETYTDDRRADIMMELTHNRCMNTLTFLQQKKPFQVRTVGNSFIDLGFISEIDLYSIIQQQKTVDHGHIPGNQGFTFSTQQQQPQQPQQQQQ